MFRFFMKMAIYMEFVWEKSKIENRKMTEKFWAGTGF